MKETDTVTLIFVTHHNHVVMADYALKNANAEMRYWYDARDAVLNKKDGWEEAEKWLKHGTIATNHYYDGSEETHASVIVAVEHIVGMYIKYGPDVQKTAADAVKKMADMMDRDARRGEEWRSEEGD